VLETQAKERETAMTGLLADAQALREQAVEAERKALACQQDAERLGREAEEQRKDLEGCTASLATANNKFSRLSEQLQGIRTELKIQ
jgi:hypothetical protein